MLYDQLPAKEEAAHAHYAATLGGFTQDDLGFKPNTAWGHDYFYPETTLKRAVVLHYTMGALAGDIPTLTNASNPPQGHVSVSFVAARNGRIYRLFDPQQWSYHLGPGTVGDNKVCSSATIGVEMSNRGPLSLSSDGKTLMDAYGQAYCAASQTEAYVRLPTPYRGTSYFATFTDAQYAAVAALLGRLGSRFDIPLSMLPEPERYQVFDAKTATSYRGVCSHVNFRPTGKTDVGPAFDWDRLGLTVQA